MCLDLRVYGGKRERARSPAARAHFLIVEQIARSRVTRGVVTARLSRSPPPFVTSSGRWHALDASTSRPLSVRRATHPGIRNATSGKRVAHMSRHALTASGYQNIRIRSPRSMPCLRSGTLGHSAPRIFVSGAERDTPGNRGRTRARLEQPGERRTPGAAETTSALKPDLDPLLQRWRPAARSTAFSQAAVGLAS